MSSGVLPPPVLRSRAHEWAVLGVLTLIQFASVLDYVIMMPLGPLFLRTFGIDAKAFGWLVSTYSLAAGAAAFLAATAIDRFDRKRLLIGLFVGFAVGTAACGLAPSYATLLLARLVTGLFGGVMGGVVMAMVADLIPLSRRGAAIGMVTSAFPLASILGVPIGLELSIAWGWHAPFLVLAGLCVLVLPIVIRVVPSLPPSAVGRAQSQSARAHLGRLVALATRPAYRQALVVTCLMVSSSGVVIPFISTYMTRNVGIAEGDLKWLYVCGGAVTFFTMNLVGRAVDRFGRLRVLVWAGVGSIITTLGMTFLPATTLPWAVLAMIGYMVGNSSRWVAVSTLVNGVAAPADRGGFLAVNSAAQSFANGLATAVGGILVGASANGGLAHFGGVGLLSIGLLIACVWSARPVERYLAARGEERD